MPDQHPIVFLLDVDNTLLDSDRVVADLMRHLDRPAAETARGRLVSRTSTAVTSVVYFTLSESSATLSA